MVEQTFEQFLKKERERLTKARDGALAKRADVDANIAAIDAEFVAIDAYEAAKQGLAPGVRKRGKRRTGVRDEVLAVVKKHPHGITRGELLRAMGAKGNKSEEQSISNALAALKKMSKVEAKDGRYRSV